MLFSSCLRVVLLLLCAIVISCRGQKFTTGTCPGLNSFTTATFTLTNLVNTWREVARTKSIYRHDWKCVTYNIVAVTPSVKYTFSMTGVKKGGGLGRAAGSMDVFNVAGGVSGAGTYFRITTTYGQKEITLNYYIVRVSIQQNYISLYACENYLFGKLESAIVLVRPALPDINLAAALNSLSQYGVDRNDLVYTYTNECL
ncbi:uncharacterized protein LOC124164582 [Ischnura elegans]|uniref:uncharacterized protein LOC124164582 n=1 Tax=Ischnura elegans TaxID=197161 RepID=UPI001ED8B114|nr:uncharacterized protein LOC124164582 [Ischnura elegans]